MYRVLMCTALAGALSVPAKADETLKWRHVHHSTSNQTQQVGDVNGHMLGFFRWSGVAFFPDGSTGTSLVVGTNDFVNGVGGTANGYYSVNFGDGSELWLKFTGTFKPGTAGKIPIKGTAIVVSGKGRYEGAKGDGTWEGEGIREGTPDAMEYIDNVINIKK